MTGGNSARAPPGRAGLAFRVPQPRQKATKSIKIRRIRGKHQSCIQTLKRTQKCQKGLDFAVRRIQTIKVGIATSPPKIRFI
jgi:hypothetical protein